MEVVAVSGCILLIISGCLSSSPSHSLAEKVHPLIENLCPIVPTYIKELIKVSLDNMQLSPVYEVKWQLLN
jgi:hypothetical protein